MRALISAIAGSIFGLGLLVSGMTDTRKVQGWLDLVGDWDPTLAFVMGGAILPMTVAWRVAARRSGPVLGGAFPGPAGREITPSLVAGAILFGMGWGLSGLCPGPAMASLAWGGLGGLVFLATLLVGMIFAPPVRARLEPVARAT